MGNFIPNGRGFHDRFWANLLAQSSPLVELGAAQNYTA